MIPRNPFAEEERVVTGIDIGASGIKLVTLRQNEEGHPEIVHVSVSPFERREAGGAEEPELHAQLVAALRAAKEAHGIALGKVVIALPRERATVRYMDLPSTAEEEVEEMLMFDVERHVPFPLSELQLDFAVVGHKEENSSTVMVVAAPLTEVDDLVRLYGEAGIQVEAVDVDVLASCAAYLYDRQDTTQVRAILDIGHGKTDLGVMVGDKVRFSRSTPLAALQLQGDLGQSSSPRASGQAYPPWVAELATDLNRQIKAYECEPDAEKVKEVVVCGGAATLPGLEHYLATQLGRRVRTSPPELDGIAGVDGSLAPEMTVALGLALRSLGQPEINLLPTPIIEERETARRRRVLRNIGIYVGIVLVLAAGIVAVKFHAKYQHRARLLDAIAEIEPLIADIRQKKAELADIQANVDADNSFYKVLKDLYMRTPEGVMYLNFTFEKKKQLDLRGRAAKDDDVYNLVKVLKESPYFQDVVLGNMRWQNMYKQPVREFDITCVLKSNEEYRKPGGRRSSRRRT